MSTTIDSRVVEMQFDNQNFERNVQTSLGTIDKLKQSLNLTGAAKGLDSVNSAAKNVDMTGLGGAVEAVQAKFSALQVMGVTALANITNSAVNAGKRIVSALTIDPVKTGFSEYETKINAIQTIMSNTASKGTTMEDVTRVIGELNTYADKTIYNFAEMTRNIGTFTAAGVGLEESAAAIQGIANLAAASGSNSQQASTAMYQLSQALSTGTVRLMDWNSVVNAGMGGEKFQEALKATAREHGVSVDNIIKKNGSFRDSLQDGWLSADILNETLRKFTVEGAKEYADSMVKSGKYTKEQADALIKEAQAMEDAATKVKTFTQLWDTLKESAQSGWSQTWEIIVGDFEEAKETLTKFSEVIGNIIGASADARNELLQGWKDAGGRADIIDSLYNVFEGIRSIIAPIKEAFREIFPPTTVEQLVGFTRGLKELTAKFKLSETTANNLKRTFKGIFALFDIARQIISAVIKAVGSLFGTMGDLGGGILSVTATLGDWLVGINEAIKKSEFFSKVLQGIVKVVKFVANAIKGAFTLILDLFRGIGSGASSAMSSIGSAFENWSLITILETIWNLIKQLASGILTALNTLTGGLVDAVKDEGLSGILDILKSIVAGGVGVTIISFVNNLKDTFGGVGDLIESFTDIFGGLGGVLEGYQTKLKAGALLKIAFAIAILAASVLLLSSIESEKLYDSVVAISMLFAAIVGAFAILNATGKDIRATKKATTIMLSLAASVLLLAIALKQIASFDFDQMVQGILGVAALMAIMVGTLKLLDMAGIKKGIKGATSIVIFAAAIKILASVCEDLAALSWTELAKGLLGVGTLMAAVVGFLQLTKKISAKSIITATGIVLLAAAIKILASACSDFGQMPITEILKGLSSIGLVLLELAMFINMTKSAKGMIQTGLGLIAIAAAMKIFASVMKDLASMSWGELVKGLVGMGGALVTLGLAIKLLPKNLIVTGLGLIAIATALVIMASALNKLGGMSWTEIAKGLLMLGSSLGILAVGLKAMNGTLKGSAALLVAVASLALLVPILLIFGSMSWSSIAKGLITIAAAFTILGVAGAVLGPIAAQMMMVAGAMALVGLAAALFGAGILAIGTGLISIVGALGMLVAVFASAGDTLFDIIERSISSICKGVADGIVAFCEVISKGAPAIGEAITAVVLTLCDVLVQCAPVIADAILTIIVEVLESLVKYTPQIVDALFRFVIGILDSFARNIPTLIQKIFDIIMAVFQGAIDALSNIDPDTLIKGIAALGLMTALVAALAAITPMIPAAMVGAIGVGAVVTELAFVLAAIGALAQLPALDWLINEGGKLLQSIGKAIGGFIGGIIGGFAEGVTSSFPQIGSDLSEFMINLQPFIDGAKQIDSSVLEGVRSIVGVILALTGAHIVDSLTSWLTGGSSLAEFGEDIAAFGPSIKAYADSVAGIDVEAIKASADAAKALAEMADTIPNEGGIISWFAGDNSIANFSEEIVSLGTGLKGFSDAVVGVVPENIIAAANAAKALADMTALIPDQGGIVTWFAGDNSIANFSEEIITLGEGLKGFSDAVVGVVPENIIAAANAAKALADMTAIIPDEGGIVSWFAGDNSVSKFGEEIVSLGTGLKGFSDAVIGIVPENIVAAANAAKALADMASVVPDEGGVVSWFAGDNSVASFGDKLPALGRGLKGFSDAVVGIVPENVTAAANAAKTLGEMMSFIPDQGGIFAWFAGDVSMSDFSEDIVELGKGLKGFSDATVGIAPETVTAAANAAKTLAEMMSCIPDQGGIVAWFAGDVSLSKFGEDIVALGEGLKGFSDATEGIVPENVTAAAESAKALAEMASVIPDEGGLVTWFVGDNSIASFGDKLPTLGEGLKGFSDAVKGIVPENVIAAADAAKALAEMADTAPSNTDDLVSFGENLKTFGKSLGSYFSSTNDISDGSISSSNSALESIQKVADLESGNIDSLASAIDELTDAIKNLGSTSKGSIDEVRKSLEQLGKAGVKGLFDAFKGIDEDLYKIGQNAIKAFIKGIESQESAAKRACRTLAQRCADALKEKESTFKSAGRQLVAGFINGITANIYKAEAKARAMAKAAAEAAEEALDINSPSRVGYGIGDFFGMGFVNALDDYADRSYSAGSEIASSAKTGLSDAISKIGSVIDSDMDVNPTISPVLDLSNVRSGANAINNMLGFGSSIGVMSRVGTISSMMNNRNQNGANGDVVSAIDKLRKDLGKVGNTTYSINGITYDDGSNISEAVKTLVRAAKVERRT